MTIGVLVVLFYCSKVYKGIPTLIGLGKVRDLKKFFIGLSIPVILFVLTLLIGLATGLIKDVQLKLDSVIWIGFLINILGTFLFEAFPEEVMFRGFILTELKKKYRFISSLVLHIIIFCAVAVFAALLSGLLANDISFNILRNIPQYILFVIALHLYKAYTQSIWVTMFFHLFHLEIAKYVLIPNNLSILSFDEMYTYVFEGIGMWVFYLGSIVILGILLTIDRYRCKNK